MNEFKYRFVTNWQIKAPINQVWDALYNQEEWPNWWKGVKQVEITANGDEKALAKRHSICGKAFCHIRFLLQWKVLL